MHAAAEGDAKVAIFDEIVELMLSGACRPVHVTDEITQACCSAILLKEPTTFVSEWAKLAARSGRHDVATAVLMTQVELLSTQVSTLSTELKAMQAKRARK